MRVETLLPLDDGRPPSLSRELMYHDCVADDFGPPSDVKFGYLGLAYCCYVTPVFQWDGP